MTVAAVDEAEAGGGSSTSRRRNFSIQRRTPMLALLPALAGLIFLVLPLVGLVARTPWATLPQRLVAPQVLAALRLSVQTATIATVLCLLFGVPLAWMLARTSFRGRQLVRALVTVPMVLPPVVGGVALLLVFGRRGMVGDWLDTSLGITLPFTAIAVVMAQAFVSLPFLVIAVEGALRGADTRYEEAASSLGASRWTTFRRVTLPLIAPGVVAGAVLCWARALGEFGATMTFAGNFPGRTQTMPVAVYLALEADLDAAIVLSLMLLIVAVAILASLREKWLSSGAAQ